MKIPSSRMVPLGLLMLAFAGHAVAVMPNGAEKTAASANSSFSGQRNTGIAGSPVVHEEPAVKDVKKRKSDSGQRSDNGAISNSSAMRPQVPEIPSR